MGKEEVIEYVMTTPNNPNRAVLEGMLEEVSGTQLPSPTASDNGKVLGVSNGEYALVEQSGGGTEPLIITLTGDVIEWISVGTETGETYAYAYTNITLTQLAEAFDNGSPCIFVYEETLDSSEQYTIEISSGRPYGKDLIDAYTQESAHTLFTEFNTLGAVKNEYPDGDYTLSRDDNPTTDATMLVVACDLI